MCYQFIMNQVYAVLLKTSLVILMLYTFDAQAQLLQPDDRPFFTDKLILEPLPMTISRHKIKRNSSVHESLIAADVPAPVIHNIVKASRKTFNLSRIQPGIQFEIARYPDGTIDNVTFNLGTLEKLKIAYSHKEWTSEIIEIPTTTEIVHYSGSVKDSFWSSGMEAKLNPYLIVSFAEVFAWQVDFSREVRNGDQWRFSIEKLFANGEAVGWGKILFAQYTNQGEEFKAYYYKNEDSDIQGHFDEKGDSLRKVFLKSPMKFGRISSRFSRRRFHPVQKRYKPHNGVDYAAPRGTPIRAVGDGRIAKIGRYGGSGKMIVLKHMSSYVTKYLHMSRFKKGLRRGSRVKQGQTIGYVGSTGLATGPHLHFELHAFGRVVDPLKVDLPSSDPIPQNVMNAYIDHVNNVDRKIASAIPEIKDDKKL